MSNAHDGPAGVVEHGRVRQPQHLGGEPLVLEDDSNQFLGAASIEIERLEHHFVGVIAERRHALAVEDALDAQFELIFRRQAAGRIELEDFVDKWTPVCLFGG